MKQLNQPKCINNLIRFGCNQTGFWCLPLRVGKSDSSAAFQTTGFNVILIKWIILGAYDRNFFGLCTFFC